jgi:glycosyltransferase involved in cell wall biosynthesis
LKVLILNNDFRVYWKGRLIFLRSFLFEKDIHFNAVELFGKGSPYAFDFYEDNKTWWTCLFPDKSADELTKEEVKEAVFFKLDQINPDIIIAPSIVFYAGALGLRWAKARKRKFVMFDDAMPFQVKRNAFVQFVKDLLIKQADAIWFPSEAYLKAYPHLVKPKINVFYGFNCIDNQKFGRFGLSNLDAHNFICVARLVPIKNLNNLLTAWNAVEQKYHDYTLTIIGDGPERERLLKTKADLNLVNVFFAGAIDNIALPEFFKKADALILPSWSETWGLVVNEAMAAGLPVLLSNKVNAAHNLLKNGINGFCFNPGDPAEIAAMMIKYICLDQSEKKEMSVNSLKIIGGMDYRNMGNNLFNAITEIHRGRYKKTNAFVGVLINKWYGRYNTSGWDKL